MSLTFEDNGTFAIAEKKSENSFDFIFMNPIGAVRKRGVDDVDPSDLALGISAIERGAPPEKVYEMLGIGSAMDLGREYEDEESEFMFLPRVQECVYIAAMQGLGKSHIAKEYARRFRYMFPDRDIKLISTHEDDETYDDGVEIEQFMANESLMGEDLSPEALRDNLVIFDDVDNLGDNKDLDNFIQGTVRRLITQGRKYNISVLYLGHNLMDGKKTKSLLNEANKLIIFPANNIYANEAVMKNYCGFKKPMIDKVTRLKELSRWVCISRSSIPAYVVHERGIFLV